MSYQQRKKNLKIPIDNQMPDFSHKGKKLHPLTLTEAGSLDKGDTLKYIGPATKPGTQKGNIASYMSYGSWPTRRFTDDCHPMYRWMQRRAFKLHERPKIIYDKAGRATLQIQKDTPTAPIESFALVERGDPTGIEFRRAKKFIPVNLAAAKRDIEYARRRATNSIDRYLDKLPLHRRMEILKNLTPTEKNIYDFLGKPLGDIMVQPEPEDAT